MSVMCKIGWHAIHQKKENMPEFCRRLKITFCTKLNFCEVKINGFYSKLYSISQIIQMDP